MESSAAVAALSALAHAARLGVFRLLVKAGPEGRRAGDIAREIGAPANTTSSHLAILTAAGLIAARRDGRQIFYRADYGRMRELLGFLVDDCCEGRPEICAALGEPGARAATC